MWKDLKTHKKIWHTHTNFVCTEGNMVMAKRSLCTTVEKIKINKINLASRDEKM